MLRIFGPIAQLVEHLAFNQGVAGSSPAGPSIYICFMAKENDSTDHSFEFP